MSNYILELKSYDSKGATKTIYVPYRMATEIAISEGVNKIEITLFERLET